MILILVLSKNFNRFLKSWCELTWKEMLLRRGKPNSFPLFTGLPGWMHKTLVKSLPKTLWKVQRKIGWADKQLGDLTFSWTDTSRVFIKRSVEVQLVRCGRCESSTPPLAPPYASNVFINYKGEEDIKGFIKAHSLLSQC